MPCKRARRVIFLWVDREHEQLPAGLLARHFEECPECRDHALRVERVVGMVRARCCRQQAPGRLVERIRIVLEEA
jgi:predicted anti-sigma-YlaC factor YlaD